MFVSMYHITTKVSIFSLTAYLRASNFFAHAVIFVPTSPGSAKFGAADRHRWDGKSALSEA